VARNPQCTGFGTEEACAGWWALAVQGFGAAAAEKQGLLVVHLVTVTGASVPQSASLRIAVLIAAALACFVCL
jgi:hypothetical protein